MAATALFFGKRAISILDWPLARLQTLLQRDVAWIIAIGFVVVLQIALILTHIPWLDETQALLIATEPARLSDMFAILHFEGHPFLWYLLLRFLASFIPAAWALATASLLCAAVIQAAILARAPFSRGERVLLALNEIFLFEYGAISRGLSLGVALVLVSMVLWRSRAVWIPIALLPTCEFLFGVLSLGLIALLWRQRRLWAPGLVFWIACSVAATASIFPAPDAQPAVAAGPLSAELSLFVDRIGTILFPFKTSPDGMVWNGTAPFGAGLLLAPLFLIWALKRTAHSELQRRLFFGFFLVCLVVSSFVYPLHFRYVSLLALFLVVLTWIDPPPVKDVWWGVWLLVGALCGLATSAVAFSRPFDAAPEAAAVLRRIDDGRRPLLAYPTASIPPLYALTGKRFVQPEQGCSQGYALWNHRSPIRTHAQLREALSKWAKAYGQSIIILNYLPRRMSPRVFKPLTRRLEGYDSQYYVVGILGLHQPVRQQVFPSCRPGPSRTPTALRHS